MTRDPKKTGKKKADILVQSWAKEATTDPDQINKWSDANPDAVPGMPTGAFLAFDLDLDLDDGKDGLTEYKALGLDPETALFAIDTPSGGEHLYFGNREVLSISKEVVSPGIDTRGCGGFVFALGTWTIFGEYRIKRGDLSDLQFGCLTEVPKPIRVALTKSKETVNQPSPGNADFETIRDALSYVSSDCGYEEWVNILMAVHHGTGGSKNGLALVIGWSAGHQTFTFKEVQTKWHSFGKKDGRQITVGTLFDLAEENGWKRSDPNDLPTDEDASGPLNLRDIDRMLGGRKAILPRYG